MLQYVWTFGNFLDHWGMELPSTACVCTSDWCYCCRYCIWCIQLNYIAFVKQGLYSCKFTKLYNIFYFSSRELCNCKAIRTCPPNCIFGWKSYCRIPWQGRRHSNSVSLQCLSLFYRCFYANADCNFNRTVILSCKVL